MKKYIALILAALLLTLPSCGSSEPDAGETVPETTLPAETAVPETETETEEEKPKYERPESVEVIDYDTLELSGEAVYDRAAGLFVMYFTHEKLQYDADAKCSIGLISDEEAISVTGKPDMTAYTDMVTGDGTFRGIAIRVDEEIPAGDYLVSVTFANYIVSFEQAIS